MHGLVLSLWSVRLLDGRDADTLLTSLTLKYYGEQLDLEAFLQEMPDYLVAEMGRYGCARRTVLLRQARHRVAGPKRHDHDVDVKAYARGKRRRV